MRCSGSTLEGGSPATQEASKKTARALYQRWSRRPREFLKSFSTSRVHCQWWVENDGGFDDLVVVTP